jgi:hypothetical protein
MSDDKWDTRISLVRRLMGVTPTNESDSSMWRLTTNSIFSVKSMYVDYMNGHTVFLKIYLWRINVPLKIRIFMWFLYLKNASY